MFKHAPERPKLTVNESPAASCLPHVRRVVESAKKELALSQQAKERHLVGQSKPVQMAEVEQSENLLQVAPRRSATQRPDRLERARCKTEARALPALASTPVPAAEAHMAPKFRRAHGRWPAMLFGVVVGGVAGASAVSLAAIGVGVLGPQSQTAPHVSVGEAADAAHDQASDPQQTPPVDASLMEPGTPPPSFPLALTNATVGALPTPPAEEVESELARVFVSGTARQRAGDSCATMRYS